MSKDIKVSAIILAAGFSSRMGELKALLDIGGKKALQHLIDENIRAGIKDIVLVLGFKHEEIMGEINLQGVRCVVNENFVSGMYSSVQKGVSEISPDSKGFMIMPVDIPLIKAHTIKELTEFFMENNYHIISPFFNNLIGHPPVLSAECATSILSTVPAGGLNDIINSKEWSIYKFDTLDEGILYEMDTKEQYYRLLEYYNDSYIPNKQECKEIIKRCGVPDNIVFHMKAVAETALKIGEALKNSGLELDLKLLYTAALLHDIRRCEKNHAMIAKEFLSELGYEKLSEVVGEHMNLTDCCVTWGLERLSEKEVLYLADKLVQEHKLVGLDTRFEQVLKDYDKAEDKIRKRYEDAKKIVEMVEKVTGKSLGEIILLEEKQYRG